jgi:hypothetical protein
VLAIEALLKDVVGAEHVKDQLPVFFPTCEGPTDLRMSGEDLCPCDDCVRDSRRQLRRSKLGRITQRCVWTTPKKGMLGLATIDELAL